MRGSERRARVHDAAATIVLAGLTAALATGCAGDREEPEEAAAEIPARPDYESMSFPYEFEPAQKRAVGRFMEGRDAWRLAVATDNTNQLLGRMKRDQPAYEPYFLEGDLTGDGEADFALVLTNDNGTFRVVWFRATGIGYGPPQPVTNLSWLDEGGLFLEDGDLLVGEFFTDRVQRYRWDAETRRLEQREATGEPRS